MWIYMAFRRGERGINPYIHTVFERTVLNGSRLVVEADEYSMMTANVM